MDLSDIAPHISDRRKAMLADAVGQIEAGIAAGLVRNQDFTKAKEIINWSVDEAEEAFLATGPHAAGHNLSDWWGFAYAADAFVSGSHTLPTVLKRAQKHGGLTEYADFIERALLPLHVLLKVAKPLVVKRGDNRMPPPPKTAEQIAREAASMTCQCCGHHYLANTGYMAHHGYRRPGGGWQTASCSGAQAVPFEVGRDRLGALIQGLKDWEARYMAARRDIQDEVAPVVLRIKDSRAPFDRMGNQPVLSIDVTRANFEAARAARVNDFIAYGFHDFDWVKTRDLERKDREIAGVRREIKAQQARYDGWKQTHRFVAGECEKINHRQSDVEVTGKPPAGWQRDADIDADDASHNRAHA
jgi:hypothetical protein